MFCDLRWDVFLLGNFVEHIRINSIGELDRFEILGLMLQFYFSVLKPLRSLVSTVSVQKKVENSNFELSRRVILNHSIAKRIEEVTENCLNFRP